MNRKFETHQQLETVVSVRCIDGEIRMEPERRQSVFIIPDTHVGLGSRQSSFGNPMSLKSMDAVMKKIPFSQQKKKLYLIIIVLLLDIIHS